jgi:2-octaprenyl-6-methoxyphenol hydroxylase
VAALVELLRDQHALGLDVGSAQILERYARWRRGDSLSMTAFTDVLDRLFSNNIPPLRFMRRMGLGIVNRSPRLKKQLMKRAMGLTGDAPKLLRGAHSH